MPDTKLHITEKNGTAELTFSGKLTVSTIEDMIPELNTAIDKFKTFQITVSDTESFDMAAVQVLVSLKKTLEQEQKKATFSFKIPEKIRESLETTGILSYFNK